MNKTTNGNEKINNTQRKILANLAVDILDKKIQQARDESGELIAQIKHKVREELGITAMDMEIETMQRRIEVLQKKKEELGFSKYNDSLILGSQAKTLVDKRASTANEKIRQLEDKKTDVISRIWTSTTLSSALAVLDEARNI